MKNVLKISLLAIVLGLGFSSCTSESLDDATTIETVASDPPNQDLNPPTDPTD